MLKTRNIPTCTASASLASFSSSSSFPTAINRSSCTASARYRLLELSQSEPFAIGRIEVLEDVITPGAALDALVNSVRQQANRVIELSPNTPDEAAQVLNSITNSIGVLADFLAANLQADTVEKQRMLEELDVEKRLRMIAARLATQLDVLELQSKIQSQVKENIDKSQRRYYLQEQLKAIRKELGDAEGGGGGGEVETLRQKLVAAKLPEPIMKEADRELNRLEAIPSRVAGVWRHPHIPPDSQRAPLGAHNRRQNRSGRGARDTRSRSSRLGQGQTPDHRIPGSVETQDQPVKRAELPGNPLLRRPARRRQDEPR